MFQEFRADNICATSSSILQLYLACVLCHAALSKLDWSTSGAPQPGGGVESVIDTPGNVDCPCPPQACSSTFMQAQSCHPGRRCHSCQSLGASAPAPPTAAPTGTAPAFTAPATACTAAASATLACSWPAQCNAVCHGKRIGGPTAAWQAPPLPHASVSPWVSCSPC